MVHGIKDIKSFLNFKLEVILHPQNCKSHLLNCECNWDITLVFPFPEVTIF